MIKPPKLFSSLPLRLSLGNDLGGKLSALKNGASSPRAATRQLELLLPFRWPEQDGEIKWCVSAGGIPEDQGSASSIQEINEEYRQLPIVVYLDANDTSLMQVQLPSTSKKNLARAIPYAMEDRLLGDIDQQFITWTRGADSTISVCIISHDRMQAILGALEEQQLQPVTMMPATLSAPMMENNWTFVFNGDGGWLRTDSYSGVACDQVIDRPPYAITRLLDDARSREQIPNGLLLVNAPESVDAELWSKNLELEIFLPEGGFWENLDRSQPSMNLLHDQYRSKAASQASPQKILPAAILAGLLVLGNVGIFGWQWIQLFNESRQLKSEMTSIFVEAFPEQAGAVIDPGAQMQANLERLRRDAGGTGPTDFLNLLALSANPLANEASATLNTARYRNNSLVVSLKVTNYQHLDNLVKKLKSGNLVAEIAKADSDGSGVKADIKITYPAGAK